MKKYLKYLYTQYSLLKLRFLKKADGYIGPQTNFIFTGLSRIISPLHKNKQKK